MSLFPVVSSLDAVDANYLTIKTAEGFLVHYHDLQRLEEPGASPTPVIPAPATDANHVRIVSSVAGNFGSNRRGKLASAARKKNEKRKRFCFFARRDALSPSPRSRGPRLTPNTLAPLFF